MKKTSFSILGALVLGGLSGAPALAHSTPSILQMGGDKARVSHGDNSACEEQRGIHVCGATIKSTSADTALAGRDVKRIMQKEIRILVDRPNRRCLRKEDVVPGVGCRFRRRFTQGFYADRIARGL